MVKDDLKCRGGGGWWDNQPELNRWRTEFKKWPIGGTAAHLSPNLASGQLHGSMRLIHLHSLESARKLC